MVNKIITGTVFMLCVCSAAAQPEPEYHDVGVTTLQDCLAKGLENNFSIRMVTKNKKFKSFTLSM